MNTFIQKTTLILFVHLKPKRNCQYIHVIHINKGVTNIFVLLFIFILRKKKYHYESFTLESFKLF